MFTKTLKRRDLLRSAAVAGGGILVAACQPKIVETVVKETVVVAGTPQVIEKTVQQVVKETVVVQKAAPEAQKVVFYHGWMEAIAGPVIEPMVRQFEKEHPGVFVSLIFGKVEGKVMGAVAAGTPPEICWSYFAPLVGADALVSLDDYLAQSGYAKDQVYQYLIDAYTVKGRLLGMPIENSVVAYWYHPSLFEQEGMPQPTAEWDWTAYRETARKLTKVEGDRPVQYGTFWAMAKNYIFWTLLLQAGGSFLKEDLSGPAFNSEAGVRALSFLADLVLQDKSAPPPGGEIQAGFESAKYATNFDGPWRWGNWIGELSLPVTTVMAPKDPVTGSRTEIVYGIPLSILKTTQAKQDASWVFLDWFLSKDINAEWAVRTGYLPIRRDVTETQVYKEYLAGPGSQMAAFVDSFEYGVYMQGREVMPSHSRIRTMFNDECWDNVMLGRMTPEEGLARAERAMIAEKELFDRIDL